MRLRIRAVISVCLAAALAVAATGCGQGSDQKQVVLVQQPWGDLVVENQITSQLLGELGYEVEIKELSVPLGAEALASGNVDAYLGNWWPSQKSAYKKYIDSGKIEVAGTLLTGVKYAPAVPQYVVEEHGVKSLADLDAKAELFENEILGIEPGSPGNQYITDAIEADAYGLGDWELVQSSTAAMLSEVQRRAQEKKPVAFLAWKPHWMNIDWDLHYLEDPEDVWPGAGEIRAVHREGYAEENPNVAKFLSQIKVERETASDWIFKLSKKDVPAEKIAGNWISEHPDEVEAWLKGVTTVDGKPAPIP